MKSTTLEKETNSTSALTPFRVNQALVAIELGQTDPTIFSYLKFFSELLPIEKSSFIHVIPDTRLLTSFYKKSGDPNFNKYTLIDQLNEELDEGIKEYFDTTSENNFHAILEGNPLEELLKTGKEINADLVLIGQNSKNRYHSILGKNLARGIKGNALMIPDGAPRSLNRILVPIDFSDNSKKALETAVRINRQLKSPATITCLNVFEMPNLSRFKINKSQKDFENMIRSNKQEAMNAFMKSIPEADRANIETQLLLKDTPGTSKYIMKAVKKYQSDFVIMGAKGHSQVDLLLMGSVTEKFLNLNKSVACMIVK